MKKILTNTYTEWITVATNKILHMCMGLPQYYCTRQLHSLHVSLATHTCPTSIIITWYNNKDIIF